MADHFVVGTALAQHQLAISDAFEHALHFEQIVPLEDAPIIVRDKMLNAINLRKCNVKTEIYRLDNTTLQLSALTLQSFESLLHATTLFKPSRGYAMGRSPSLSVRYLSKARQSAIAATQAIQAKRGRNDKTASAREIMPVMLPTRDQVLFTVGPHSVDQLPRYSGVYRFYGAEGDLLYIGKSVDIRARVAAHYQEGKHPGRHQRIMQQVTRIDCTPTAGEVGALLIENAAIKRETPLYNRRQRRVKKLWTIHLKESPDGFAQPTAADFLVEGERSIDSYGLFHNKRHVDSTLRRYAKDHGLCLRMLGLDKGRGPCFQYQLARCDGACAGEETAEEHNNRLVSVLDRDRIAAWPFPGPLVLIETNVTPLEGQPCEQGHLINHWCYLGSFDSVEEAKSALSPGMQQLFDRDAYHLLLSALKKGRVSLFDAVDQREIDNPFLGELPRP